jgi:hypothetical protein
MHSPVSERGEEHPHFSCPCPCLRRDSEIMDRFDRASVRNDGPGGPVKRYAKEEQWKLVFTATDPISLWLLACEIVWGQLISSQSDQAH